MPFSMDAGQTVSREVMNTITNLNLQKYRMGSLSQVTVMRHVNKETLNFNSYPRIMTEFHILAGSTTLD